jgi:hypothetical protein
LQRLAGVPVKKRNETLFTVFFQKRNEKYLRKQETKRNETILKETKLKRRNNPVSQKKTKNVKFFFCYRNKFYLNLFIRFDKILVKHTIIKSSIFSANSKLLVHWPYILFLRATACKNWHILGKFNSHYFLLRWNSLQIFFSLYKKYKLNIFGLQNCAPPFLQSSKSAVLQFSWNAPIFVILFKNIQNNLM